MFWSEFFSLNFWWIFPLAMIALCFFMCFFVMRGRMGSMMCKSGCCGGDSQRTNASDSAIETPDKRRLSAK